MPRGPKGERRPADVIGNAVHVMRLATGQITDDVPSPEDEGKSAAAVELGRLGEGRERKKCRKNNELRLPETRPRRAGKDSRLEGRIMGNALKGIIAGFVATLILSGLMLLNSTMDLMPQINIVRMLANLATLSTTAAWMDHFIVGVVIWGLLFAVYDGVATRP